MKQYLELLREVLNHGELREDRTGVGTLSIFSYKMRFKLANGFPLVTTKKVHWKSIAHELLWFLRGETNSKILEAYGVKIWRDWADENGELGPIYGAQWRAWNGEIDQIDTILREIRENPNSRRMVVSAWNVAHLPSMALPPCHVLFQFYVAGNRLYCQVYQRSADCFLGVPFNIASYALLTHLIAHQSDLEVGDLVWIGGDCHIYSNHIHQVTQQISRDPLRLPTLQITTKMDKIEHYGFEDLTLIDYRYHPAIPAPLAV